MENNYTLTGLSKAEVEAIGERRYQEKNGTKWLGFLLSGVACALLAVAFENYIIKVSLLVVGCLLIIYVGFIMSRQRSKAGRLFFKEVTSK